MSKYQQQKQDIELINGNRIIEKLPLSAQKAGCIKTSNIKEIQNPKLKIKNYHYKSMKLLRQNSGEQLNSKIRNPIGNNLLAAHVESDISKIPKFLSILNQKKNERNLKERSISRYDHQQTKFKEYSPKTEKIMLKETSSTTGTTGKRQNFSPSSIPSFVSHKCSSILNSNYILQQKNRKHSFKILKKIGQGKFGKVYLAKQKSTGFLVALKQVKKKKIIEQNLLTQFIRQLKTQLFLNHPNIIKVYGFFQDKHNFYTIMEYGSDGQLYKKIEQKQVVTEEGASFIAKNLLEAVSYLHMNKIIHRDIKPQNIVLIHGNVKLCDFGWAVHSDTQLRSTFCGTPLYLSPQLLMGDKYNSKVDIWAVGILIYQLLLGNSPFDIQHSSDLFNIIKSDIRYPQNAQISEQFKIFVSKILEKDPIKRLECEQLLKLSFIIQYNQLQTCQQFCK